MKLCYFFSAMFVFVGYEIHTASSCSSIDIIACNEPVEQFTAESFSDLKRVCSVFQAANDCMEKELDTCPSVTKLEFASSMQVNSDRMEILCGDSTGFCTVDDGMKCAERITQLRQNNRTDLFKVCTETREAMDCMKKKIEVCPEMAKLVNATLFHLQIDDINAACGNVSDGCSYDNVMACVTPIKQMTYKDYQDQNKVCSTLLAAVDCLEQVVKLCPPSFQKILSSSRDSLDTVREICDKDGPTGVPATSPTGDPATSTDDPGMVSYCKYQGVVQCMAHNQQPRPSDKKEYCSFLHDEMSCLNGFVSECKDDSLILYIVEDLMKQTAGSMKQCTGSSANGIHSSVITLFLSAIMIVFPHFM